MKAEDVAKGLSEAQREVLCMEPWSGWRIFTYWPDHLHTAMQRLQIDGLFDSHSHWNARWNESGLAVRALLTAPDSGEG